MTGFAKVNINLKSDLLYSQSFGLLPDRTRYYDPFNNVDLRTTQLKSIFQKGFNSIQQKALTTTTGGAGTAGYALIPVYIDPAIVDTTRKFTPLLELIPKVANRGMYADWITITAKGGATFAAEDASLTETNDTYARNSKQIKFAYAVGRVTGPTLAAMPSYMLEGFQPTGSGLYGSNFGSSNAPNSMQLEILLKARELNELLENEIINGDTSVNANGFDGIVKQQGTTNQVDLAGAALSYDDIETAVRYAYDDGGRPNLAICSSSVLADIRKILIDQFHYRPADMTQGMPFGIPSGLVYQSMIGPITIIPSQFMSNTGGSKQIYFLDTNYIELRVLQDITYEELAKTNDSRKFMLKWYGVLVLKNPAFNSFIDNIA